MGDQSHCTLKNEKRSVKGNSLRAPRYSENKSSCLQICMVAKSWLRRGAIVQRMWNMSAGAKEASACSTTPVGVSRCVLEKTAHRLCWPFLNNMFMIVVDSYTKWLQVFYVSQITLWHIKATVTRLKRLFASYSLPEQIVTDNTTTFTSEEFQTFVKQNGILHTTSAPGHPATNGLAERHVQTFKVGLKKTVSTTMNSWMVRTAVFLRTLLIPLCSHQSSWSLNLWLWGAQHKCVNHPGDLCNETACCTLYVILYMPCRSQ